MNANSKRKIKRKVEVCKRDCIIRVNLALAALTPALDYAIGVFPMLRDHLPENFYAVGLILIVAFNVLFRIKTGDE